jgi:thiamine transport system permease protein
MGASSATIAHRARLGGGHLARIGLLAVPAAFLAVFFVYPVASIIGRGLAPGGRLDLSPISDVIGDAHLRGVAWFTIWQAALSTALTVLVALPGAHVFARYEFFGKRVVRAAVIVPFVLPTVVVGSAFLSLLGDGGPLGFLGLDQSLAAILLAHVFFNYAVVVLIVGGLWAHLDPRQEDAARVLGAGRWQTFRAVTLPALRPAVAAAAAIVFLFDFTSFGVILILGGPSYSTLETEIYRQTAQLLNLPQAAALSIVQLAAVITILLVAGRAQGSRVEALRLRAGAETARRPRTARERASVGVNLSFMALLLGAPVAVLVERSFHPSGGFGLGYYRALSELRATSTIFVPPIEAVRNSLEFAAIATVIAVAIGGLAAFAIAAPRRSGRIRGLDTLLLLPLGISAVTIGFGFLIALDHPPFDLRRSAMLIPIAHALVAAPFVARVMIPVLRSIDQRLRDAAALLGAPPSRVWREIDLPIVGRALLVAAGFAFAISLGEFGATIFIARPDYPTLPVVIFRLLGQPGTLNFGAAMAASVILMAVTAVSILAIERFRVAGVGEF